MEAISYPKARKSLNRINISMNVSDMDGHLCDNNIATIQKYTRMITENNIVGVDIGTLNGKSAAAMASARDDIQVYTIDPLHHPLLDSQIKEYENIIFLQIPSIEYRPTKAHIVFVDGFHGYREVSDDINNICSKVVPGGYILFHDYNLYSNTIGKAVDENEGIVYKKIGIDIGLKPPKKNYERADIYIARKI